MSTDAAIRDERASGKTPTEEVTDEEAKDFAQSVDDKILPQERDRWSRGPGFARMSTDWSNADDRAMMARIADKIDEMMWEAFPDAYAILHELYEVVREQVVDGKTQEPKVDAHGWPVWKKTPTGNYVEDWDKLTEKQAKRFLFLITTRLFNWQQAQADSWGEAMYAKAVWEESFAQGYESLKKISANKPTVEDRTQRARRESAEQKYFALFKTHYSKRVDALVGTFALLNQRLKDVYAPNGR